MKLVFRMLIVVTATLTRFTDDPVAPDSGQFPLGRPMRTPDNSLPMTCAETPLWLYDHERQIAVGADDQKLRMATANKVTNNDGDEGPSEDFTYDFAPDAPGSSA